MPLGIMSQFDGMTGKILAWVATAFLGLLTFLGAGIYNDQRSNTAALIENTIAIRVFSEKFDGYVATNEQRFKNIEKFIEENRK